MRIAVDVCIGRRGIELLQNAGHEVVVEAAPAEADRDWFARALAAKVDLVIAIDTDLKILCYDHNVPFLRARQDLSGRENAYRAIQKIECGAVR